MFSDYIVDCVRAVVSGNVVKVALNEAYYASVKIPKLWFHFAVQTMDALGRYIPMFKPVADAAQGAYRLVTGHPSGNLPNDVRTQPIGISLPGATSGASSRR